MYGGSDIGSGAEGLQVVAAGVKKLTLAYCLTFIIFAAGYFPTNQ